MNLETLTCSSQAALTAAQESWLKVVLCTRQCKPLTLRSKDNCVSHKQLGDELEGSG